VFTLEVGRWKEFLCPRLFGQLFDSVTKSACQEIKRFALQDEINNICSHIRCR